MKTFHCEGSTHVFTIRNVEFLEEKMNLKKNICDS